MKTLKTSPLFAAAIAGAMVFGPMAFGQDTNTAPVVSGSSSGATEPAGKGHHGHGDRLAMLTEKLGLSDKQQEDIKPIFESEREAAKAVKADTTLSEDQRKEKMRGIRKDSMEKIKALLTPEQLQKLKEMREEHHEHHDGGSAPVTSGTSGT